MSRYLTVFDVWGAQSPSSSEPELDNQTSIAASGGIRSAWLYQGA